MSTSRGANLQQLEDNVRICREAVQRSNPAMKDVEGQQNSESSDLLLERLGDVLMKLYNAAGGVQVLEEAISAYEESLRVRPLGHIRHTFALVDLGGALWRYCEYEGRDAIRLDSRGPTLDHLALALWTCFAQRGGLDTLTEAIALHREALHLFPPGHRSRDALLSNLAAGLATLFEHQGDIDALSEAIVLHQEALQLRPSGHPSRYSSLMNLANSLKVRFDHIGGLHTLSEAIILYREALEQSPSWHPMRDMMLSNLAVSLITRFETEGNVDTLAEAIALYREALQLRPAGHPARGILLDNLANALATRFRYQGGLDALAEAITLHYEALHLCPPGHPARGSTLNNLAIALLNRFRLQSNLDTLAEAIRLLREVVELQPTAHPTRSASLNNLANALKQRCRHEGDLEMLAEAVALHREALQLCPPGHPFRDSSLSNLAAILMSRFEYEDISVGLETLTEAIALSRSALQLRQQGHPERDATLSNLADALSLHRQQQGALNVATELEVISLHKEALQLRPCGHPERAHSLSALAQHLLSPGSDMFDFATGVSHISEALADNTASFHLRVHIALTRLNSLELVYKTISKSDDASARTERDRRVLQIYVQAIQLLPRAAHFGLDTRTRLQTITGSDGLSRNAAARAIGVGSLTTALEVLEEGRGIFWSQALHLRSSGLDGVPEKDRHNLQGMFNVLNTGDSLLGNKSQSIEERERVLEERRVLNDQVEALIFKIRAYPGLGRFLLPPSFDSIMSSLPDGFVVILNASRLGCHALLFHRNTGLATSMRLKPPPGGFNSEDIRVHMPRNEGVGLSEDGAGNFRAMSTDAEQFTKFEDVLATLWIRIMQPVIKTLGLKKANGRDRPRLWCVVTGELGFLPIHAAGKAGGVGKGFTSDYVVFSYVPTLSALARARSNWKPIPRSEVCGALVCEASSGRTYLPSVLDEVNVVRGCLESAQAKVVSTATEHTSRAQMHSMLTNSTNSTTQILHLASHGVQDEDPLQSGFELQDGRFSIEDLMRLDLPHAVLAFLSACQTAKGDRHAPDQAVHLAASMLFCGFRSVIGTLWLMNDKEGPKVARCVYQRLFEKEQLDLDDIPYALDEAICQLREEGLPASRWALFVHMGG